MPMAYLLASEIHGPRHIADVETYVKPYVGALRDPRAPAPERFPLMIHATGGTTAAAEEARGRFKVANTPVGLAESSDLNRLGPA